MRRSRARPRPARRPAEPVPVGAGPEWLAGRRRWDRLMWRRRPETGEWQALQTTVVRCADGHQFSTSQFPMQQLGSERIGPGRLLRCPRCARLRSAVPVERR
ncbi:hypothetical protein GCM10009716_18120 [Streptomyces sodiiphilus]|uniref:Formate-dependent nitrite reductase complex subunit NrfF n=1 Tax=Streptomyces sodiiphilus TaxID=226217 RepID=A0ABN2P3B9_9ACTN